MSSRRLAQVLWPLAAIAVAGLLLWKLPQWQTRAWRGSVTRNELLLLQNELRQTLLLLLGAGALLTALALVGRRAAASERAALNALTLVQEGQQLERYTRAVGQLADARLEVRLGAIYGLERIAAESPAQHGPIVEVLCAYLRDRAAWDTERPQPPRVPPDLQAVLTVLGRRTLAHEVGGAPRLDLRRTDLRGADLDGMRLEHTILAGAHLEGASLQGARLAGADLRGADLSRADLVEADLKGADLRQAHLEAAYLVEAHLEGADLGGAFMAGAYLGGAYLQGTDLGGAQLDGAYLYKAQLDGASLHGARVMSAIGVARDERERINRTAAEAEAPPPQVSKPVSLRVSGQIGKPRRFVPASQRRRGAG